MSENPVVRDERVIPVLPDAAVKLFGFCRRSGRIVCGAGQVLASVTGRRPPFVVVIASDASDRTEKQIYDKCSFRDVKLVRTVLTGAELAHLLGKDGVVMAAGATDSAIAAQIIRHIPADE